MAKTSLYDWVISGVFNITSPTFFIEISSFSETNDISSPGTNSDKTPVILISHFLDISPFSYPYIFSSVLIPSPWSIVLTTLEHPKNWFIDLLV